MSCRNDNHSGHILKKMQTENCKKNDLIVNIKTRNPRRFKAGSELSGKVNLVAVEFNEEVSETSELLEVKLKISSEACEAAPVSES